ncbi:MAG: polysaccharide pyruvyl transferase family protein [Methanomassiliicoccaceae archaeon]|nr:polysaccharide pyruvyl transferase family protein [Methanomassiliicoccaceae archaeon]
MTGRTDGDYSMIGYSTNNIGDDIQSVAASRFLPKVDRFVNRENMWRYDGPKTKMILNAFYMDTSKHFPPSDSIDPLLTSMHVTPLWRDGIMKRGKQYLLDHGPVGCRDRSTLEYMQENDVPAYFSGCLTLTLLPNPGIERQGHILAVDVPEKEVEAMRKMTDRPIFELSHDFWESYSMDVRHRFAKSFLYLYSSAHCVVTRRMHAALPSLSVGTPVVLLDHDLEKFPGRFSGLRELVHCMTHEEFDSGGYDVDTPPPNPEKHLDIRNALVNSCTGFTGHDNGSVIGPVSLPEVMGLVRCTEADRIREFHSIWKLEMARLIYSRFIKKNRPEDIE